MKIRVLVVISCMAAMQFLSGAPRAADAEEAFDAVVRAKYALITKAYATGDAALFRQFYAQDAVVFGENQPAIVGLDALLQAWSGILPSRKSARVDSRINYLSADATLGVGIALLHAEKKDPAAPAVDETILTVWKKSGQDWRCVSEVFVKGDRVAEYQH